MVIKQRWFSGRILACHAGGPGSIPGRCNLFTISYKSIEGTPEHELVVIDICRAWNDPVLSRARRRAFRLGCPGKKKSTFYLFSKSGLGGEKFYIFTEVFLAPC